MSSGKKQDRHHTGRNDVHTNVVRASFLFSCAKVSPGIFHSDGLGGGQFPLASVATAAMMSVVKAVPVFPDRKSTWIFITLFPGGDWCFSKRSAQPSMALMPNWSKSKSI
jgi:hypothetical protein